jgi:hypothetical protein
MVRDTLFQKLVLKLNNLPLSEALMFMASTMPAYALGFFITIILNGMGFSEEMSLLLTAPPYVAAVSFFPHILPTLLNRF